MKRLICTATLLLLGALTHSATAQSKPTQKQAADRPHIVVGMVVDQMSWDYLYRFNHHFGSGGFRRLMSEGFNCHNARIDYIPSVTAIGHATVYTGSVPSIHGIAGNDFYNDGKPLYCTQDSTVTSVGAPNSTAGQMSPRNMRVTTITDELRLATNFRSKVIGVALKDRGAILPAGHSANAAYWYDDKNGGFITSTYYMDKLPRWVERFNERHNAESYLSRSWQPSLHIKEYSESEPDANRYEGDWDSKTPATLPVNTKALYKAQGAGIIRTTPSGNTITLDMAKAAIEGESLGERKDETDFLAVSLSSTDYIGHKFGTFSVELEDTYIKLDRELADLFAYLDKKFGKDGYLFFLTADHAAGHNITFLEDHKLPGRAFRSKRAAQVADSVARAVLGTDESVIINVKNYQVFFDEARLDALKADRNKLYCAVARAIEKIDGVAYAVPSALGNVAGLPEEIRYRIVNGYNRSRSGAVTIVLHPGWYSHNSDKVATGTTHSVWAPYDTHIPLIFMGHGIKAGQLYREVHMTDIAPTLAFLLKTQIPSGSIGKPIVELLER